MDLKDTWRQKRLRERAKEPLTPSRFSQVGGLVRRYKLGAEFCRRLETLTEAGAEKLAREAGSMAKVPYEPPLFFLATPEEFQVIQEIISTLDNPYLSWAHSPEEMLLSPYLWRRRPDLDQEELATHHLAGLFWSD
ncbi:MAG: hypothetical protein ACOC8G_01735 [Thermodesulfobacteriota bacterium]